MFFKDVFGSTSQKCAFSIPSFNDWWSVFHARVDVQLPQCTLMGWRKSLWHKTICCPTWLFSDCLDWFEYWRISWALLVAIAPNICKLSDIFTELDLVARNVCDTADIQQNVGIFQRICQFMVRRCNACIASNGGNIEHLLWNFQTSCTIFVISLHINIFDQ